LPRGWSGGQGMSGPQMGTGRAEAALWWLGMARIVVVEETEAAAPPARTKAKAIMRMASFIVSNLIRILIDRNRFFPNT